MFKVICIDDKPRPNCCNENWILKYGEIYTVISIEPGKCVDGTIYDNQYCLHEDSEYVYPPERFIPLSSIDETELIKEREHETCKV